MHDVRRPSRVALHRALAATPSRLLGVALTDVVGETARHEPAGTHAEYPNWQVPLADRNGDPVLLDDLVELPFAAELAAAVRGHGSA